ncbi:MAG TPA: SpaA isopeptide-forming pilin-related protein, partial [Candidatus Caenarcaniphilales bacterium]|nr:SpaA isopeptide-forming pilin-related protein [Candidatus Caenarcaniphilales bacterium]
APGSYSYLIVALGVDGQQRVYGDGGLDGEPLTLDIDDGETGAFFAFDPRTDQVTAEPVGALYQLATDDGEQTLTPDGDQLTAVVVAPGGDFPFEFVLNGEPQGGQSVFLDPGRYRLTFDQDGNLLDSEQLTEGTLSITRADGATGACYQLRREDEVVNQACDVDDGDDGVTTMTFPEGLEPGGHTLIETTTPEGAETAGIDLELTEGDNTVEIPAGDGEDIATDTETETTGIIDTNTAGTTETETTTEGEAPGDLIVTLQSAEGQAIGGACFELVDDDGEVVEESCDTAESGDTNPGNGNTGFFGVPSGTYMLRLSDAPEGVASADEREVTIPANDEAAEVVTATADDDETTATTEATTTTTEELGNLVVLRQDDAGNAVGGACFEIVDDEDETVAAEVCDEDGDVADDGRIGFFDVPAGVWTLRETRTPPTVEPAAEQQVEIFTNDSTDLPVQSAALETETETETETATEPVPGDLIVTLQSEDGQPIGGACFELLDEDGNVVEESCDTAEFGDTNPGNGNTGFFGVPSGDYTLRLSEVPEGVQPPDDQPAEVPAGGETPGTAIVTVAVEETTETATATETETEGADEQTGIVVVEFAELAAVDPGRPVCVELNTAGGIGLTDPPGACDNGDGDANTQGGAIRLENVPVGEYTLSVTDGPEGATAIAPQGVTVTTGQEALVELALPAPPTPTQTPTPAAPESGTLTITVEDPQGQPVAGTCFDVTNESGTFEFCDEDGDGTLVVEEVAFGQQTIEQTEAPEGFALAAPQTVDVTEEQPEAEITVVNTAEVGFLPVIAVDADDVELPGACWMLIGEDTEFGPQCDEGGPNGSPPDGRIGFEQVPPGEYTLREDSPPEGYLPVEDRTVTVQGGENEAIRLAHELAPATVRVTTTGSEGTRLNGACYTIDGGEEICDIDGDGVINFEGIAPGSHTLDQTTAPENYQEAADTGFSIEPGQSLVEVGVVNEPATGTVSVVVEDEANQRLGQACASVDGGAEVCDEADADAFPDEGGRIGIAEVAAGDHSVALTEVPPDFEAPADEEPVTVVAGEAAEAEFTLASEQPATGNLALTIRSTGDATDLLPGVCVRISGGGQVVEYCDGGTGDADTQANGVIRLEGLATVEHNVELTDESAGQIEGFEDAESLNVLIEANETVEDTLDVTVDFEPTTGVVEIVSRDATSQELIAGACYELRSDADPIILCDDGENDEDGTDGVILRSGVPGGRYLLVQTTTPATYETAANVPNVVVSPPDTRTVIVELKQEEQPGTLVVEKVDTNGELLAGACFEVRQGNTLVADQCEGADGDGVFTFELMAGDYRLRETRAPSNDYRVAGSSTVTVAAEQETRVQVVNRLRPGRVEITTVDAANPD